MNQANQPLVDYRFDLRTVDLILRALGKLPYEEVAGTVTGIAQHAQATLKPPPAAKPSRKTKAQA